MYSVDCTPTWIVPVPKAIDSSSPPPRSESAGGFLNNTGGSDIGAPPGSARRFSSFSSLAAALKGERTAPLMACLRPLQLQQDQQTVVLPQQARTAQQDQMLLEQQQHLSQQQGSASFGSPLPSQIQPVSDLLSLDGRTSYSTGLQEWLPHNATELAAPALSRSKKHQRLSAGNRGKFAADPYRVGGRTAGPRMSAGSTTSSSKPPCPSRSTPAGEKDLTAVTGGAADTEDEGAEQLSGVHDDDSSGNAGYEALQNALACVVASGRSTELLIWGVRCLIERDFPCLYNKHGRTLTGLELPLDLPAKSAASAEGDFSCVCSSGVQSKVSASKLVGGGKEAAASSCGNSTLLFQEECCGTGNSSSSKLGVKSSSSSPEDGPGICDDCGAQRTSLTGTAVECCCGNGNCLGRQIVVVSMEGHRQRDRRVLKWVRHNHLRSGDVVILITAWERAEEPKYLRVPGMILSSSVDASSYNFTMATRLTSRVKQLGAALLSDCRVYPLVVPLGCCCSNCLPVHECSVCLCVDPHSHTLDMKNALELCSCSTVHPPCAWCETSRTSDEGTGGKLAMSERKRTTGGSAGGGITWPHVAATGIEIAFGSDDCPIHAAQAA